MLGCVLGFGAFMFTYVVGLGFAVFSVGLGFAVLVLGWVLLF
jgi:hypothetical protein